jgi:hypothetical protein
LSNQQVKDLLVQLQTELESTELDSATRDLLEELDKDIHDALAEPDKPLAAGILSKTAELETKFATHHPLAERFLRELIDALARMGI